MYLLYADESGSTIDASQKHFVLAGFCAFERQGYWLSNGLEQIAKRFNPAELRRRIDDKVAQLWKIA